MYHVSVAALSCGSLSGLWAYRAISSSEMCIWVDSLTTILGLHDAALTNFVCLYHAALWFYDNAVLVMAELYDSYSSTTVGACTWLRQGYHQKQLKGKHTARPLPLLDKELLAVLPMVLYLLNDANVRESPIPAWHIPVLLHQALPCTSHNLVT